MPALQDVSLRIDEATEEWVCDDQHGNELWREQSLDDARIRLDIMEVHQRHGWV